MNLDEDDEDEKETDQKGKEQPSERYVVELRRVHGAPAND
jgi:hypothetical protein